MSVIDNCKMLFTSGALLVLSGAFAAESGVPAVEDPVIPPAAVYDNGGLFAEFDARENAGAGMHDDTARSWVNLKSDEFPAVWMLDNESPAWSETGVTFAITRSNALRSPGISWLPLAIIGPFRRL